MAASCRPRIRDQKWAPRFSLTRGRVLLQINQPWAHEAHETHAAKRPSLFALAGAPRIHRWQLPTIRGKTAPQVFWSGPDSGQLGLAGQLRFTEGVLASLARQAAVYTITLQAASRRGGGWYIISVHDGASSQGEKIKKGAMQHPE
jgi:hypothetical protein